MPTIREKSFVDLGWPQLLAELATRCHTTRGSAHARALALLDHKAEAQQRIEEIAEARLLWQLAEPMPFAGIHDIEALLGRVDKGGDLVGTELLSVGQTVAGAARLRRHLVAREAQAPRLHQRISGVTELGHVSGPLLDCIEDGGRIADHASPALGPMRRKVAALNDELGHRVRILLDDPEIAPYLQDRFYTQREDRYVVPLRAEARARVRGIVHGTSQSGHTVFVEPEAVVDLNNRLKMAESDVAEEERRILGELSGYVREELPAIRLALEVLDGLDVLDGAARLADALEAAAPVIAEDGELALRRARHPLMVLAGRTCVPNDITLAPGRTLVISGPNAGGKTVALKTAGLCALLVRAGLHVPAVDDSRVPWYEVVETDIGDDQSLERNLSTFSAHVMNILSFLEHSGPRALVLVDELAVGTDPDQGSALAQAVLEALAERGAHVIVTTHYERLKAMPTADARFVNASVGFDLERMAPTFKLHHGVPGSSGAFLVARRLGLPGSILGRAEELLGDRRAGIEELLTAVTEERRRLDIERAAAETARREAEAALREAQGRERAVRAREAELRRGAHDEAVVALRRARDELDALKKRLRDTEKADVIGEARAQVAALAQKVAERAPEAKGPGGRPVTAADLVPGKAVVVASLGGRGVIVGPVEKGRVTVQIGALKTTVSVEDLRLDDTPKRSGGGGGGGGSGGGSGGKAATVRRRPAAVEKAADPAAADREELAPARTADATCDVRGQRVDDALAEVDRFIDDSLLGYREVVFIIHGHGTGALRDAIREKLDLNPGVDHWRPGQEKEGGDGVTVAWLDV
jgi:DNA mismatch repair protein MutS2